MAALSYPLGTGKKGLEGEQSKQMLFIFNDILFKRHGRNEFSAGETRRKKFMNRHPYKDRIPEIIWELVFGSLRKAGPLLPGPDSRTRHISYTHELLMLLDIDFHRWPRVTVTGSKGKGSTAVLLASILQGSGERVGLVSSPEMRRFNERIRIDGTCVSDDMLVWAANRIAPAVRSLIERIQPPHYLGSGGVVLALAATLFAEAGVSAVVVEAGRGGEYDEARLIEANVSVLTPIMLEHADKLGSTTQAIAHTKALITFPGSPLVTAPQIEEVQKVIEDVGKELQSEVHSVVQEMSLEHVTNERMGVRCDLQFGEHAFQNLLISLPGLHQAENAATAILAAFQLKRIAGTNWTTEGISQGLQEVSWPGRAHMLQQEPWVLLDGAINREAAEQIATIVHVHPAKRLTAVVCVPKPKDLEGLCAIIGPLVTTLILTKVPVHHLAWYENASAIASQWCTDVRTIDVPETAFHYALSQAGPDEGVLLLGTQSFLGTALTFWDVDTCRVWQKHA